jgi:hypothetical protein
VRCLPARRHRLRSGGRRLGGLRRSGPSAVARRPRKVNAPARRRYAKRAEPSGAMEAKRPRRLAQVRGRERAQVLVHGQSTRHRKHDRVQRVEPVPDPLRFAHHPTGSARLQNERASANGCTRSASSSVRRRCAAPSAPRPPPAAASRREARDVGGVAHHHVGGRGRERLLQLGAPHARVREAARPRGRAPPRWPSRPAARGVHVHSESVALRAMSSSRKPHEPAAPVSSTIRITRASPSPPAAGRPSRAAAPPPREDAEQCVLRREEAREAKRRAEAGEAVTFDGEQWERPAEGTGRANGTRGDKEDGCECGDDAACGAYLLHSVRERAQGVPPAKRRHPSHAAGVRTRVEGW